MQKLSKDTLYKVVKKLEREFETKVSEEKFQDYLELLGDLTDEQLMNGVISLLRDREFNQHKFPKVSEIRQFALGSNKEKEALIQSKSIIAKGLLDEAVKKAGGYKTVVFDDPVIHAIVRNKFGGWGNICKTDIDELKNFFKFDFDKLYKAYTIQGIGIVDLKLKGRAELQNEGKFNTDNQIMYFGKKERIEKWQNKMKQIKNNRSEVLQIAEAKSVNHYLK